MPAVKEKIPLDFVRKYLSAKGYKETFHYWCECDSEIYYKEDICDGHPIRWLWEHIKQGHEPSFDCCHSWDRQVGRGTGEFEEWYRWFTFTWCREYSEWLVADTYQGLEGWEEPSPAYCWRTRIGNRWLTWADVEKERKERGITNEPVGFK